MELRDKLKEGVRLDGICADGYRQVCGLDLEGLLRYYVRCADWCLERSFPDIEVIRGDFDREMLSRFGIFVDRRFDGELLCDFQSYIFHNCSGRILTALNREKEIIPIYYFANGCEMEIRCEQRNNYGAIRVPLYVFGKNEVVAEDSGNAYFVKYKAELKHEPE